VAAAQKKQRSSPLTERLQAVNPDTLSPKEALDLIYDLKNLANSGY
jgi:DNA mismatch repair protein MutS